MKVLVVGTGGREHAISWRLKQSPSVTRIVCPNGNPGIAQVAETPKISFKNVADWAAYAKKEAFDLVVVGPEDPLEAGITDEMLALGIKVFGPPKAGAKLESSKAFAKEVMAAAGVPTAQAKSFSNADDAIEFTKSLGIPVVIKADGLAAGKGVTVARSWEEAEQAIRENLEGLRFGEASSSILVEEFMDGVEASVFGLCDGTDVFPLVPAQDHKPAYDNDKGPNTGGMGAYAPTPFVDDAVCEMIQEKVLKPTLAELKKRGIDFRGVLYAGLMLTKDGPKIVEFNCRFGDPETQVVLPLLEGDFGEILMACAEGRLAELVQKGAIATKKQFVTTVVLASGGYPGNYSKGLPISGLEKWDGVEDTIVFHAGTATNEDGQVVTNGGRVLACTAMAGTLAASQAKAYEMVNSISFDNAHFRTDIAAKALK